MHGRATTTDARKAETVAALHRFNEAGAAKTVGRRLDYKLRLLNHIQLVCNRRTHTSPSRSKYVIFRRLSFAHRSSFTTVQLNLLTCSPNRRQNRTHSTGTLKLEITFLGGRGEDKKRERRKREGRKDEGHQHERDDDQTLALAEEASERQDRSTGTCASGLDRCMAGKLAKKQNRLRIKRRHQTRKIRTRMKGAGEGKKGEMTTWTDNTAKGPWRRRAAHTLGRTRM